MDDFRTPVTFSSGATATVEQAGGRLLVTIVGEFDECFAGPGAALLEMLAGQHLPVDVDLSGLTFASAAAVTWLLRLYSVVPQDVRVVGTSAPVVELADICSVPLGHDGTLPQLRRLADAT